MPSAVAKGLNAVSTVFWTAIYFVYFLFKGKKEWKCEKNGRLVVQYCCDDVSSSDQHEQNGVRLRKNGSNHTSYINNHQDNHNATPKSFYSWNTGVSGFLKSTWAYVKESATKVWNYGKRSWRKVWNGIKAGAVFLWKVIKCFFTVIYAFIVSNNVPSQSLPSTPKPYTATPSSPSYNKVAFDYQPEKLNETELRSATKSEIQEEEDEDPTIYEDVSKREEPPKKVPDTSESFYYERVYDEPKQPEPRQEPPREKSIPPPPPPPPPPKPVSREPSRARSMTPGRERKEVKGGIGGFKSDIMDELEEQQRARQERASVNREMTQSCHPDMAQWKASEPVDRSANSTPWRASSVGPTMRRLEQVVSRVDGGDDQREANFVFRPPKIVHSSEEYRNRQQSSAANDNGFMMGRSVFSPVEEAERMRSDINRKQQSYSSPQYQSGNWMEGQRSRNIHTRNDQVHDYQAQRNPFGSAAYKSSPYASHTARRSKTPIRGTAEPENGVESVARQWPPVSNATGASSARDDWVGRSMRGGVEENDDGLVMTMCRRVVEKKKDENWKWRDESGRLLDERHNNTWKGELDTLLRDGPNEGRHWSRTVEKLPTGDTRFQDVNRQYNKEYVVESIVRNY